MKVLATIITSLALASPASANWYLDRGEAASATRDVISRNYRKPAPYFVSCRVAARYITKDRRYHIWKCGWQSRQGAGAWAGEVVILGRHGDGYYWFHTMFKTFIEDD